METTSNLKKFLNLCTGLPSALLLSLLTSSCGERPALYGSPAQLEVNATRISFSSVEEGRIERKYFDITNKGDTTAYLKQWDPVEAPFHLLGPEDVAAGVHLCDGDLAAHSSCTVVVEFRPQSAGDYAQKFTARFQNSPDAASELSLDLLGRSVPVPAAVISFDPGAIWDFGSQFVGSNSSKLITIENSGNAAAQILTTSFMNAPFSYTGGAFPGAGGDCGAQLNAGESCTFAVDFTPGVAGNFASQFVLQYNDSRSSRLKSLNFSGTGQNTLEATLGYTVGSLLHFGFLDLGLDKILNVELTNSGTTDATAITVSSLSAPFSFAGGAYPGTGGDCGSTLAAGASCTLALKFSPSLAGFASGLLTLDYTHAFGFKTLELGLDGTGSPLVEAHLDFSLGNLFDFGDADVNTNQAVTLTVTNSGDLEARFISPSPLNGVLSFLGGAFPGTGGTCSSALSASQSCTVRLSFAPLIGGLVSDVLSMQYHDGTAPTTSSITLTGTGIPGGTLDGTFGTAGIALVHFSADQAVRSLEIPASGKILLVGDTANGGTSDFSLIRLDSNGSIDTSYGSGGRVVTDVNSGSDDLVLSSTMQADEKIIVTGRSNNRIALARYRTDGANDSGFNSGGLIPGVNSLLISLGNSAELGYQAAVSSSGLITLVGELEHSSNNNSFAAQFTSSGAANILNFGLLGYKTYDLGSSDDGWRTVRTDANGKLVAAGYRTVAGVKRVLVSRLATNGSADSGFGSGGHYSQDLSGANTDNQVSALALQPDGKIILAGTVVNGATSDAVIFRLNTNGTLDNTFAGSGVFKLDVAGTDDGAVAVAVDSAGRVLVAVNYVEGADHAVATLRLKSDGSRDTAFGVNGVSTWHNAGQNAWLSSLKLQSDGKIVVGGHIETVAGTDALVMRYLP